MLIRSSLLAVSRRTQRVSAGTRRTPRRRGVAEIESLTSLTVAADGTDDTGVIGTNRPPPVCDSFVATTYT